MSHIETRLAQAGTEPDAETGALVPPIHRATTYERAPDGSYPRGYVYARHGNPTSHRLEETLAELEGGAACAAFASGMAAAHAVCLALEPGDHLILSDDVYYGVRQLLDDVMGRWNLSYEQVDLSDVEALDQALRPDTRMVWVETPSNPLLKVIDLQAVAACMDSTDAHLVVDGTWTTPLLQQPLAHGADLVLHSLTKYMAGHSDVLGGAVIAAEEDALLERIRTVQRSAGAVMDPSAAWLTLRGLRSMGSRLRVQCENARTLAEFLDEAPAVERVFYPGLPTHPGHDAARRQMSDFGGMLSFQVQGGREAALAVAAEVKVFTRGTSLGGTESLIEHRASIEAKPTRTPDNLLRVSVGLEDANDLCADLEQALEKATGSP